MNVQVTKGLSEEEKQRFEESRKLASTYREVCLNYIDSKIGSIQKQRLSRDLFSLFNWKQRQLAFNEEERVLQEVRKLFLD